jgi:hypothetical protein
MYVDLSFIHSCYTCGRSSYKQRLPIPDLALKRMPKPSPPCPHIPALLSVMVKSTPTGSMEYYSCDISAANNQWSTPAMP